MSDGGILQRRIRTGRRSGAVPQSGRTLFRVGDDRCPLVFDVVLVVGSVRQRISPRGHVCGRVFLVFGSLVGCNSTGKRNQCSVLALSVSRYPEFLKREGRT